MSIAEKIQTIAENEQLVYEAGKQAEYDRFWDLYQENGNRTLYQFAFAGSGWNEENLKPKYDIKPIRANYMFSGWEKSFDLAEQIQKSGVIFDTSQCTSFLYFLQYVAPSVIPTIDTRSCTTLTNFSSGSTVKKIEKIILREDGSQTVKTMFSGNHYSLKEIVFEGVVGQDFSMNTCSALSKASIENIVSVLSATATGKTLSISKTAKEREFTDNEWQTLIATKPNWTISLI